MKKGFTLIETLIYIGLFMIIIGSGFYTAMQLIQSGEYMTEKTVVNSEIDFVLRKIDSALNGASSISNPTSGSDDELSINKYVGGSVQIRKTGDSIEINRGSGWVPLTTVNVKVESLNFERISGTPSGIVSSVIIDGIQATTTRYIRQ